MDDTCWVCVLLPPLTLLGYVCKDLLSPYDGMHVRTDQTSVYILIRKRVVFFFCLFFFLGGGGGGGVRTRVNSKGKILSTGKYIPQIRIEPTTQHQGRTASPTRYQLSYSGLHCYDSTREQNSTARSWNRTQVCCCRSGRLYH